MSNPISLRRIKETLEATVIEGEELLDETVEHVYASDLMSDVLAFGKSNSILITGLASRQAVISSHISEFKAVVFVRGKLPKDGADVYARDKQLLLLSTKLDLYDSCACIAALEHGEEKKAEISEDQLSEETVLAREFFVEGRDFANAGMVSTEIKELLKQIGFDSQLVRRVALATYEGELNVIMHADRGMMKLFVSPKAIEIFIEDEGKGIPDLELAMQEGFTTASEEMRKMGFGSGMGLPNMKKNSDELKINTQVGKGTTLYMKFNNP
jgi:serine/threonine-protein kinase RsbT